MTEPPDEVRNEPAQPHDEPAIRVFFSGPDAEPYDAPCPNCGAAGPHRRVLEVAWIAPKLPEGDRKGVFACADCTARFYPPLNVPNYGDPEVMDWGWHQFHIQQGAGLLPISDPLARIAAPQGTRFLEIGCGYGFGLDYVIQARQWQAMGIDPSPLARLGAADLGIEIRDGYFPEAAPEGRVWDVIAATEVIEHVQHPTELLADLRARLTPDGILLLTTPDGDAIKPDTPEAVLVQLLAPGIHMVFQTEASLSRKLREAGFGGVTIRRAGETLIACAGAIEGRIIDDPAERRGSLRSWLGERARKLPLDSDLGLGFAGRALFEAAIDDDWVEAEFFEARLFEAIRAHFGLDPASMTTLPAEFHSLPLNRLKDAMPLNLSMILYAAASRRRHVRPGEERAERLFALAADAATVLNGALARLSLNDGLTEELIWHGRAEAAIEAARGGRPTAPGRVLALPAGRRRAIAWRALVELVNAGAIATARRLAADAGLANPEPDLSALLARDARIVLGQLGLAEGGDPAQAIAMAASLGADDPIAADLLLKGFTGLVNEARYDEAAPQVEAVAELIATRRDPVAADAAVCLGIFDLSSGDPATAITRSASHGFAPHIRRSLLLGAFVRLVNGGRYAEAAALTEREPIAGWAAEPDRAGHDATIALVSLTLAAGDPATVPALLDTLADTRPNFDPAVHDPDFAEAFVRLCNAGRFDAARELLNRDWASRIAGLPATLGRDVLLARTRLALADGISAAALEAHLAELEAMGVAASAVTELARAGFTHAVSTGDREGAGALLPRVGPAPGRAESEAEAGFCYALGIFHLGADPPAPLRAETGFAAARRYFTATLAAGDPAPLLFWEAVRGEAISLEHSERAAEAGALVRAMTSRYVGAPTDLLPHGGDPANPKVS